MEFQADRETHTRILKNIPFFLSEGQENLSRSTWNKESLALSNFLTLLELLYTTASYTGSGNLQFSLSPEFTYATAMIYTISSRFAG